MGGSNVAIVACAKIITPASALLCASLLLAGCSSFGGRGDKPKADPEKDPNFYPSDYQNELINFMRGYLPNANDFLGVSISDPTLKPFGQDSRYVMCVRLDSMGGKEKLVIFNNGTMSQFIDARPEYCGGVAYRHFTELEAARPR